MKIRYFKDTDTLYIEFKVTDVGETRDLDDDTQIDVDTEGNICAMTVEHASAQIFPHSTTSRWRPEP